MSGIQRHSPAIPPSSSRASSHSRMRLMMSTSSSRVVLGAMPSQECGYMSHDACDRSFTSSWADSLALTSPGRRSMPQPGSHGRGLPARSSPLSFSNGCVRPTSLIMRCGTSDAYDTKPTYGKYSVTFGGSHALSEVDLIRVCRRFGIQEPDRQVERLDSHGRLRYVDAEWTLTDGRRVVLEVDGAHHLDVRSWQVDMRRERGLVVRGARILRATAIELRAEPALVVADLLAIGVPRVVSVGGRHSDHRR
jgi:hypothetical protein